jgi:hypothetical protein
MGKWTEQRFLKEEVPMAKKKKKNPKSHEEMLNIPSHNGYANQNHVKILPHSC